MAFDTTKETMVSFLVPSQILKTIEDIRDFEGNPSRSSIIRRLINRRLKSNYDTDTKQRQTKTNN
jgi:metal-responsive CopG/Arc/MetJ family transcriptional regulator